MAVIWFVLGAAFTKGLDMGWDYFKGRRDAKREKEHEKEAEKAKEAEWAAFTMAWKRAMGRAGPSGEPWNHLVEALEEVRLETHVITGIMHPNYQPKCPRTTTPGTTTTTVAP